METATREKELLEKIENHPLTRQIRAEEAAETLGKRLLALSKIRELREQLEGCGTLRAEIDSMAGELADMDRKRGELLEKIGAKRYELAKEQSGIEGEIRHEEQTLLTCYDPRIDEAITFFRDRFYSLMGKDSDTQKRAGEQFVNEKQEMTTFTNSPARQNAMQYCRKAIKELEEMKLSPFIDADRIEELKRSIPDADAMTEYTKIVKKPEINVFPQQTAHDWKLSRLLGRH